MIRDGMFPRYRFTLGSTGRLLAGLSTEIDDLDIGSPVPRERSARVIGKQPMIFVDEIQPPSRCLSGGTGQRAYFFCTSAGYR